MNYQSSHLRIDFSWNGCFDRSKTSLEFTIHEHQHVCIHQKQHKGSVFMAPVAVSQGSKGIVAFGGQASSSSKHECLTTSKKTSLLNASMKSMGLAVMGSAAGIAGGYVLQLIGGGGSGFGGWNGGGPGGGGSGGSGDFWHGCLEHFMAFASSDDPESNFDSHGLKVGSKTNISKLNPTKRYKISGVDLMDSRTEKLVGPDDPFHELITLKPGGIFTRAQFQTELENLSGCGMFESVYLDAIPHQDGTLRMQVSFAESEWQPSEGIRCVNVGLIPQTKPPDVDFTKMTDKEREAFIKSQEEEYKQRLRMTKPVILPRKVEKDISAWLRQERRVTARILQKIRDRVQKWYHDNGFACAQVVNFGNLNTKEIVCEIVEGDITKLVVQYQDKLGLPCEGNTDMQIVERELPEQVLSSSIPLRVCV